MHDSVAGLDSVVARFVKMPNDGVLSVICSKRDICYGVCMKYLF